MVNGHRTGADDQAGKQVTEGRDGAWCVDGHQDSRLDDDDVVAGGRVQPGLGDLGRPVPAGVLRPGRDDSADLSPTLAVHRHNCSPADNQAIMSGVPFRVAVSLA